MERVIRIRTDEFDNNTLKREKIEKNKHNPISMQNNPILFDRKKPWLRTAIYKCINVPKFPFNSLIVVENQLQDGDYSGCVVEQIGNNLYKETELMNCIEIDIFRETIRKQIEIYDDYAIVIPYDGNIYTNQLEKRP